MLIHLIFRKRGINYLCNSVELYSLASYGKQVPSIRSSISYSQQLWNDLYFLVFWNKKIFESLKSKDKCFLFLHNSEILLSEALLMDFSLAQFSIEQFSFPFVYSLNKTRGEEEKEKEGSKLVTKSFMYIGIKMTNFYLYCPFI